VCFLSPYALHYWPNLSRNRDCLGYKVRLELCLFFLRVCHSVVRTPPSVAYSFSAVTSQKCVQNVCCSTGAMIGGYQESLRQQSSHIQAQNTNLLPNLILLWCCSTVQASTASTLLRHWFISSCLFSQPLFPSICTSFSTLTTPFSAICPDLETSNFAKIIYLHRSVSFNTELSPNHLSVSVFIYVPLCDR